eukprot:Colp12_sorted_trinity150504_noHs@14635
MSAMSVLSLYRSLLRRAKHLEASKQAAFIEEIRTLFRRDDMQKDLDALLKVANGKMEYLQMVTRVPKSQQQSGRRVFVFREGKLVEGYSERPGHAISNWGQGNLDPADVRRHWKLFERQRKAGL